MTNHETEISLRDWLAGMALQGLVVSYRPPVDKGETISAAIEAYELADAMLAARKKGETC